MSVVPSAGSSSALAVVMVVVPMTATRTAASLNLSFHLFHSLSVRSHNISNMSDLVEIFLQLIDLPQDVVEARNLGVRQRDRIARPIVLLLCNNLGLLGKIV
jgi:hypothetical protein